MSRVIHACAARPSSYVTLLGSGPSSVKVDTLITDPPFLLLSGKRRSSRPRLTHQAEVSRFPDTASYATFTHSWLHLALSHVKPEGTAVIFSNALGTSPIQKVMHSLNWEFEGLIPWAKWTTKGGPKSSFAHNNEILLRVCEHALVFRTPQTKRTPCTLSTGKLALWTYKNEEEGEKEEEKEKREEGSPLIHPSTKPQSMLQTLLQHLTLPGDTILDPFSGSGAISVAAKSLGRIPYAMELNESWARSSQVRLESHSTLQSGTTAKKYS